MRDPLTTADGTPRLITRVEFDVLPNGRIRWQMFSDDVLNHSECVSPESLPGCAEIATALLVDAAELKAAATAEVQP